MTPQEYFKDWIKVIDLKELDIVLKKLQVIDPEVLCPCPGNVFKAFKLCPYEKLKVVFLGQDPYPQKGVATGVLFGNKADTPENKLSPSLGVIKESCIDYETFHGVVEFDNTLESWAKQGILMINSALTCLANRVGSHVMLWRRFIATLLKNLSYRETGIIYVLFGKDAQSLRPYINEEHNDVIEIQHPAYFARTNQSMPHELFSVINGLLYKKYGEKIEWYKEF